MSLIALNMSARQLMIPRDRGTYASSSKYLSPLTLLESTLSNVILVASNNYDPITPKRFGHDMAKLLGPSARHIIQDAPGDPAETLIDTRADRAQVIASALRPSPLS